MTDSVLGNVWRTSLFVALSVVGIVLVLQAERTSETRANRLHRGGELELAASIYGERMLDDSTAERLHYNLGTTLLRQGNAEALAELAAATRAEDDGLRVDAQYNLGLWTLIQALVSPTTDSIMYWAAAAIEANKAALRLDPEHADAAWNLALARRVLVASTPNTGVSTMESPNGAPDIGEVELVEGPQPPGNDESYGDSPSEGEEEAIVEEGLEPISLSEAAEILGTGHRDPSTMTGKLLLREGRDRQRRGRVVEGPPW